MTNAEVLDLMMGRLGGRQAPLMRAKVLMELNNSIRELERGDIKPWFLEAVEEAAMVIAQGYVLVPENFLIEVEDGTFEVENSEGDWTELTKVTREKLREETANEDDAIPEGYAIWGNRFLLGPAPDLAYNYRFDYYARTIPLVDSNAALTNSWLLEFFNYTTTEALIIVAGQHIQSSEMVMKLKAEQSKNRDQFLKEVVQREMARRTLLLTDEES